MTTQIAALVDLRPFFSEVVLPLAGTALAAFSGWAVQRIGRLAHIQMNEKQAALLEGALWNGIEFAKGRLAKEIERHGVVNVKSQVVAEAANYILPKVPGIIKSLNITEKGLRDRIEARLAQHE